jgi:O6-methylguanine-DNA--protein-cysteine methyltransferase
MKLVRRTFDTPVGPMMALASDEALCALEFWKPGRMTRLDARLRRWFAPFEIEDRTNALIAQTGEWLDRYFAGGKSDDPPLDMRGAAFELKVWAALRQIPLGQNHVLRRGRPPDWCTRRVTCRRHGQRREPNRDHRPVPPCHRLRTAH